MTVIQPFQETIFEHNLTTEEHTKLFSHTDMSAERYVRLFNQDMAYIHLYRLYKLRQDMEKARCYLALVQDEALAEEASYYDIVP
jgi:hypothetical protein